MRTAQTSGTSGYQYPQPAAGTASALFLEHKVLALGLWRTGTFNAQRPASKTERGSRRAVQGRGIGSVGWRGRRGQEVES